MLEFSNSFAVENFEISDKKSNRMPENLFGFGSTPSTSKGYSLFEPKSINIFDLSQSDLNLNNLQETLSQLSCPSSEGFDKLVSQIVDDETTGRSESFDTFDNAKRLLSPNNSRCSAEINYTNFRASDLSSLWPGGDTKQQQNQHQQQRLEMTPAISCGQFTPVDRNPSLDTVQMTPTGDTLLTEDLQILSNTLSQIQTLNSLHDYAAAAGKLHEGGESMKHLRGKGSFSPGNLSKQVDLHFPARSEQFYHPVQSTSFPTYEERKNRIMHTIPSDMKGCGATQVVTSSMTTGLYRNSNHYSPISSIGPSVNTPCTTFNSQAPTEVPNLMTGSAFGNTSIRNFPIGKGKPIKSTKHLYTEMDKRADKLRSAISAQNRPRMMEKNTMSPSQFPAQQRPWNNRSRIVDRQMESYSPYVPRKEQNHYSAYASPHAIGAYAQPQLQPQSYLTPAQMQEVHTWLAAQKMATGLAPQELFHALSYNRNTMPADAYMYGQLPAFPNQHGPQDGSSQLFDPKLAFYCPPNSTADKGKYIPPHYMVGTSPYAQQKQVLSRRPEFSNDLYQRMDEYNEQFRCIELERKMTEVELSNRYSGSKVGGVNSVVVPRLPSNPTKVDRLVVESFKEHAKIVALVDLIQDATQKPVHANITSSLERWLEGIRKVQARRKEEIVNATNRNRNGGPRHQEEKDVTALTTSVTELTTLCRRARTGLWCALQMLNGHKCAHDTGKQIGQGLG